jgi:hypothetical protein
MRWPAWLLRRLGVDRDDGAAELAEREQQEKLAALLARRPVVHRQLNQFAAEVEAALTRRRHE